MNKEYMKGYFKMILAFILLIVGLLHLPSMSIQSLEGIFSLLWFAVGGLIVIANYIYITNLEKQDKRFKKVNRRRSY